MAEQNEFLKRINKTLYYGQLPTLACLSLPVTEISCSVWSECQRGRSLRRLRPEQAAKLARGACVSPAALVLALLYVERLHADNRSYIAEAEPAHLFLVSLMVGNKFLEDNGEADEVLISEWADSSGIQVEYLKKLEVEFLQAIDWKIFVSKQSFEERLQWLEKEVAIRQARERGFFTYTDLRVISEQMPTGNLGEMLTTLSAATVALAAGYTATLVTLLASTLLVTQTWLIPSTAQISMQPRSMGDVPMSGLVNTTLEEMLKSDDMLDEVTTDQVLRCTKWLKYEDKTMRRNDWIMDVVINDWMLFESWWCKTSVLNWLYQSSLINPMQRWLQKLNDISGLVKADMASKTPAKCTKQEHHTKEHCLRLNLSKLTSIVISVAE